MQYSPYFVVSHFCIIPLYMLMRMLFAHELGTKFEDMSLEDCIKASHGDANRAIIFNNTAQIWNHTFFFEG